MINNLCVELRHFELFFFVNHNSLVECRELHAEVNSNQNAKTFYEFESKIVSRNVINIEQRSIITALEELTYKRHNMHVAIQAGSISKWDRFKINNILKRLTCLFKPLLIYFKVQFYAFTSFILSDPLIGRIGAEKALYTLKSGYSQSWTIFDIRSAFILEAIETLSSEKEYYLKNKRCLQTIN